MLDGTAGMGLPEGMLGGSWEGVNGCGAAMVGGADTEAPTNSEADGDEKTVMETEDDSDVVEGGGEVIVVVGVVVVVVVAEEVA